MNFYVHPKINIEIFSAENIVTQSDNPQRKSAYDAAMANLNSKEIQSSEISVFGFE